MLVISYLWKRAKDEKILIMNKLKEEVLWYFDMRQSTLSGKSVTLSEGKNDMHRIKQLQYI